MLVSGRTHPGALLSFALTALVVCGALGGAGCKSAPQLGHALALSLLFDASVDAASLAAITSLAIHVSGDEAYDHVLVLGRAPQRDEGLVYRPAAGSRVLDVLVTGRAADDSVVALGDTGTLRLPADETLAVDLVLGSTSRVDGGVDLPDGADLGPNLDMADRYRAAILADHPRAYYRLDEKSGAKMADDSGHGYTGDYFGAFTLGQQGAIVGTAGTAVGLVPTDPGGMAVIQAPLDISGTRSYSLELWLAPDPLPPSYRHVFNLNFLDANGRQGIGVFLQQGLGLQVERWVDAVPVGFSSPAPIVGRFSHIVLVYDGSLLKLYENGVVAASLGDTRSARSVSGALYIGTSDFTADATAGVYDEVAVYDFALSDAQVKAHHDIGLAP